MSDLIKSDIAPVLYTVKEIKIYPPQADPPIFSSGAVAWGWGSWVQVVPANTITRDFIIIGVMIGMEDEGQTRRWDIQVGVGAPGAESPIISLSGVHSYSGTGVYRAGVIIPLSIPRRVKANSRVAARVSDHIAAALAYRIKIQYIELPL